MSLWIKQLIRTLGKDQVSTSPAIKTAHSGDAWFASHEPEAVVFACSAQDVSKALQIASRYNIPVTARGAGRGYVGGCVPVRGGIALSLMQMNRILEISQTDGIAVVQPGVITATLQAAAQRKGLFYPPDPASFKESSIGGNIATNAGGPRCVKYGVTGSFVIGLEVVLADGSITRVGGRTVKNKTGFDLTHLFVGSEGMLGIVTEATLRLIPNPPERAVLIATFKDARAAAKAVNLVQKAGFLPSAIEIADAFTLRAARNYIKGVPPGDAFLLIEVDGQAASVKYEISALAKLLKPMAVKLNHVQGRKESEQLWEIRRKMSQSLKATGLSKLNEDIVVPRGKVVDLFHFAEKLQKQYGYQVACFGHIGDGNIHVNIMVPADSSEDDPRQTAILDDLFKYVLQVGGTITGEHGIGIAKKRWWPEATSPEVRALHKAVKMALDPQGILNPGKFLE